MTGLINGGGAATTTQAEALRAAIQGYTMEHGASPDFILMSSDVAQAIFREVEGNPNKWKGFVKSVPGQHMSIMDIEIAQLQGVNRMELVADLLVYKVKRSL